MSIAVLLDYKTAYTKGADGKTVTSYVPSAKEELDEYRQLVLATVGYDEKRGDTVTLENMPFFSEPAVVEDSAACALVCQVPDLLDARHEVHGIPLYFSSSPTCSWSGRCANGCSEYRFGHTCAAQRLKARRVRSPQEVPSPNEVPLLPRSKKQLRPFPQHWGWQRRHYRASTLEADIEQELLREAEAAGAGSASTKF